MSEYLTTITAPASEPISINETKKFLRITHDDENALVSDLIKHARRLQEINTGQQFIRATYDLKFTTFKNPIYLPRPPLVSVTHIKYWDNKETSIEQTVAESIYEVDNSEEPGLIRLQYNQNWPSDMRGGEKDITIRFVCGYAEQKAVPSSIKILLWHYIQMFYRLSVPGEADSQTGEPWALKALRFSERKRQL